MDQSPSKQFKSLSLYLKDVDSHPLLTREETNELFGRMATDPSARTKLIESNLRLVLWQASKFAQSGMPMPDMIAAGNIGLMIAVDKYDPTIASFSTYAKHWIAQKIRRMITTQAQEIREPEHFQVETRKISVFIRDYTAKHGYEPSNEEVSEGTELSLSSVVRGRAKRTTFTSLNEARFGPEEGDFAEVIEDPKQVAPNVAAEASSLGSVLENLLDEVLSKRDAEIIRSRFGVGGDDPKTLAMVSDNYNITGERIRQIQVKAVSLIRKKLSSKKYDSLAQELRRSYNIKNDLASDGSIATA